MYGYMVVSTPLLEGGYRGIDRDPVVPMLLSEYWDPTYVPVQGDSRIWVWYPPGWRREAYRLFEENSISWQETPYLELVSDLLTARKVKDLIEPYEGPHEVVYCEIAPLEDMRPSAAEETAHFLGYDVAYPGGDFSSALAGVTETSHSMFIPQSMRLTSMFGHRLNDFRLFRKVEDIPPFVEMFRECIPSEANACFARYALSLA